MENKEFNLIKYSLIRSSRKSIGIIVKTDGSVVVRAPQRASIKQIEDVLNKRRDWILKHKNNFEKQGISYSKREFINGEKQLYLGDDFVLRVTAAPYNDVIINDKFIDVRSNADSNVKFLIERWYTEKANEMMPQIMMPIVAKFNSRYQKSPNKISLKNMKSRWGSCSSKGNISMNIKLMKSSISCIEYVIAHELCHLLQMNHSKNYYALLSEFMPDWKERKKMLDHYMR